MKKRGLGITGLIAIGALLVLGGCGGGGNKPLTKAQFVAKANALCVSFNDANKAAGSPTSLATAITYFEKMTPLYEKRVASFSKLKPPTSEAATVTRLVTIEKKEASLAKDVLVALKKNDKTATNTLIQSANTNSAQAKPLYQTLGLTECLK